MQEMSIFKFGLTMKLQVLDDSCLLDKFFLLVRPFTVYDQQLVASIQLDVVRQPA